MCKFIWETRAEFLEDANLNIVGYQVNFRNLADGTFLFNHTCGTTLSIEAGRFQDLYGGPIFAERARGGNDCPEYCLRKDELCPCPVECECAYVREVIQIIKNWPKNHQ
jgi:hypothetical protein